MKLRNFANATAHDVIAWCEGESIRLRVINGVLRKIPLPGKTIAPDLAAAIQRHEPEIIALVARHGSLHSVEPKVDPETGEIIEDGLPQIDASNHDVPDVTQQAWGALVADNDPPRLFRYASAMSRLETEDGRAIMRPLTEKRLSYELARVADWYTMKKSGPESAVPPLHVVNDMIATPDPPLPIVERMTHAPYFAPDGRLITTPGYDEASRTILFLDGELQLQAVPENPSTEDIAAARSLILDELYADFPFVSEADCANAVALALLPYARQMIAGPTPNHLLEAPSAGSGKGLLADAATRPAIGLHVGVITGARDDDEWRKRISAKLREAAPVILMDNITRVLDSGSLASAITADIWTDRVLGTNETMKVPVRCVWITTANNPTMTTEIARRTIRIRLDPKQDRPWQRKGFRHPNLIAWVDEHRAELIHAALVLIQAWIAAEKPAGKVTLGSFERWATVMGGILDIADVGGFLTNLDEFYEAADLEGAIWRQLVAVWWDEHKDAAVFAKDLYPLTEKVEGFDLGKGGERAQQTSFGMQLAKQRDRVIGEYRIVFAGEKQRVKKWRLIPTTINPLLPPEDGVPSEKGTQPDFPYSASENEDGGVPTCTISNPTPVNSSPDFSSAYDWGKVHKGTPEASLDADEALCDKGKPPCVPFFGGTHEDLRDWAYRAWSGEPVAAVPERIRREAQALGITYDIFKTPLGFADELVRYFEAQKEQH